MSLPLLQVDDVRIDLDGQCVLESVTLLTSGDRVGLLGHGRYLFEALAGTADVAHGELRVCGVEFQRARDSNVFAVARPWPAQASVRLRDGLELAALMAGGTVQTAKLQVSRALALLGIENLADHKLGGRTRVEHYLAGLAEAALFDPAVVVIDWPIGLLSPEGWVRYGTALARLVQHRRWLGYIPAPARLAAEQSWLGALDQLLWLENDACVELEVSSAQHIRTLVVLDALVDPLPEGLELGESRLERIRLGYPASDQRTAFVLDLPRDEYGRVVTDPVLAWCDRHSLPLFRLEPLDRGF